MKMVNRRIVVVRHGERVDFMFTDEWMNSCFDEAGVYRKQNLNMPDTVPKREGSPRSFTRDCPLTPVGVFQATLTGKGLQAEKVLRDGFEVYVSPALRSIQTAEGILKGMELDTSLRIEPTLFEWTGWFSDFMPKWLTIPELEESGCKVDTSYVPFMTVPEIVGDEETDAYYRRTNRFVLHLLSQTDKDLLLVGHGATLDAVTRQLSGLPIRNSMDMLKLIRNVPYCGVAIAEESAEKDSNNKKWSVISVPRIALRHSGIQDFHAEKVLLAGP